MTQPTVAKAVQSGFFVATNKNTKKIEKIAAISSMQIGMPDLPAKLQLFGDLIFKSLNISLKGGETYSTPENVTCLNITGSGAGTITVVLPASPINGQLLIVKDSSGTAAVNNITASGYSSQLIDGASTKTISSAYGALQLVWNGSAWNSVGIVTAAGGGSGDVTGPASSTDTAVARFNGLTGKVIQNSGVTIDGSNNITTSGDIAINGGDVTSTAATFNLVNSNATTFTAAGAATTLTIGNTSSTNNTIQGRTKFPQGLSGSLTKLTDGTSYLIAGSNVTITSASNGAVTISSTTSGASPGGLDTYVQFNDGGSTFGGDSGLTYNKNTDTLTITGDLNVNGGNIATSAPTFNLLQSSSILNIGTTTLDRTVNVGTGTGPGPISGDVAQIVTVGSKSGASSTTIQGGTANITLDATDSIVTGDLAVNGGDITTTAATFNLVNATATTVNFAGGATTGTNIGNSLGRNYISGQTEFNQGLSGSLTKLINGTSYLIAGNNVTITTGSTGAVTITSTGGSPGGLDTYVQFNDGGSTLGGDSGLTYNKTTDTLSGVNIVLSGDLTVNGTTTTINTTNLEVKDNLIGLGFASGSVKQPDGDRGIVMSRTGGGGSGNPTIYWSNNLREFAVVETPTSPTGSTISVSFYEDFHANNIQGAIVSASVGFSGSLTRLIDGTSYLIAGSNVTIATGSNGSVTISSTGGGSTPGGLDTYVQFNDGGSTFGGDSGLTYDKNTDTLTIAGDLAVNGGDITTTATTFNIVGSNATTVQIAQGATNGVNLGNSLGRNFISGYTEFNQGLSGSLTRLTDGTSYIRAGTNVTVTTASNGSITIDSSASGAPTNASYLLVGGGSGAGQLSDERTFVASTGLSATDGGANGNYTVAINDSVVATVSGTTFTGVTKHNAGMSGSLTKLTDGTSYLIAGSNVTITTGSSGAVTIAASSATPGGLDTYVQFNDGGSTFGGDSGLTYNKSTDTLTITGDLAVNGGDITTTATTFNLINSNATTVNIAGGATSGINIGNVSGINSFYGKTSFTAITGSLTKLLDGTSYLIAGSGVTITTGSNGAITIASTGASIGGSANQVIYRDASNNITGNSGFLYDGVSLKVSGNLESVYSNGDEGGEIYLNKPVTNTTLAAGVTIDVYQNKIRVFENAGTNRGGYYDVTALMGGVGTNFATDTKTHTGYTNSQHVMYTFGYETTSTAFVNANTVLTLAENQAIWIDAFIIARQTSGGNNRSVYQRQALFYRNSGGTTTQQGSTNTPWTLESAAADDVQFSIATNDIVIQVRNASGNTYAWVGTVRYQIVQTSS